MNDDKKHGFQRQRRNLMVVSLGLILIYSTGLEFDRINVLGNTANVENPESIIIIVWFLWFYWVLRFYWFSKAIYEDDLSALFTTLERKGKSRVAFRKAKTFLKKERKVSKDQKFRRTDLVIYSGGRLEQTGALELEWIEANASGEELKTHSHDIVFNRVDLWRVRLAARLRMALESRWFSEYYFPYLVAFAPLGLLACKELF